MIDNKYVREELGNPISLDKLNGITLKEIKEWINKQEREFPDHFKLRLTVEWKECEPVIGLAGTKEESM